MKIEGACHPVISVCPFKSEFIANYLASTSLKLPLSFSAYFMQVIKRDITKLSSLKNFVILLPSALSSHLLPHPLVLPILSPFVISYSQKLTTALALPLSISPFHPPLFYIPSIPNLSILFSFSFHPYYPFLLPPSLPSSNATPKCPIIHSHSSPSLPFPSLVMPILCTFPHSYPLLFHSIHIPCPHSFLLPSPHLTCIIGH